MARHILRPTGDQRYGSTGAWGNSVNALGSESDGNGYWFHENSGVICEMPTLQEGQLGGREVIAIRIAHREEQFLLDNGWVMTDLLIGEEAYRPARVYNQDGFKRFRTKKGPAVYRGRNEAWSLDDVNSMRLQVGAVRGDDWGPNKSNQWCRASQAWIEVITPANLNRPALSNLSTSSVNPELSVNVTGIEPEQMVYAVFQAAQDQDFTRSVREYTTPFNEQDSSNVALKYKGTPGTDSHANLSPGTWYYRVKIVDMLGSESEWSVTRTITVTISGLDLTPPRLTAPTTGTHRNPLMVREAVFDFGTDMFGAPKWSPGERLLGAEWRFSPSNNFDSGVIQWANYQGTFGGRTSHLVSYDPSPVNTRDPFLHGPQVSVQDVEQTLRPQGNWYGQVRAVDSFGNSSGWSSTTQFAVQHPPTATNLVPGGEDFDPAVSSFRWTFSDPWARDSQIAYQVRVLSGSTVLYNTGKVYSSVEGATVDYDFGPSPRSLTYQVRLWDTDDRESAGWASSTFRYRRAPIVTVSSPTGEVDTGQPAVKWSSVFSDGRVQSSYRVIFTNTSTGRIEYDSGVVASQANTHQVSSTSLSNMSHFEARVYVFDTGELVGWGLSLFSTNFIVPQALSTSADSGNYEEGGYVDVWWTGDVDAFFQEYRIYHREYSPELVPSEGWKLSGVVTNAGQRHYKDYTPSGAGEFEFSVVQVANRFGSLVEGEKRSTFAARTTVFSVDYWLIVPGNEELSVRLHSVVGDSFTERHESSSYEIVGGGARVNRGARIGLEGSLACQVRSSTRRGAREQMQLIRGLGDQDGYVILRDPFGNSVKVSIGDISGERIGGVGNFEFADLEIPYTEVS